jgi:molybdate transport system substrate-binding protein
MIKTAALTVFAAASLTNTFPKIDSHERYSFNGSNALAAQIRQGAPADVFASANTSIPQQLYAEGLVEKPVVFTRNALILVVPKSNPANIHCV